MCGACLQDMHVDRQRAGLVRRARDLEADKVLLQLKIAELSQEKKSSGKNQTSLKQRLKTMVTERQMEGMGAWKLP